MSPAELRRRRAALGLTQRQFALTLGIQRRTVMRLEQGRGAPIAAPLAQAVAQLAPLAQLAPFGARSTPRAPDAARGLLSYPEGRGR